jgi:quercetin dioxygenase-like cupin family protein
MATDSFERWLAQMKAMKEADPEASMPEALVTRSDSARWLDSALTGNPCRIGVLLDVPTRTMEFYLQEIPATQASDLQRHPHESVHYVLDGSGYSEIGPRRVAWTTGDFVFTPPWVWHRHYAGEGTVRMLLVENSRLLEHMGLNRRDSAGSISYAEFKSEEE